MTCCSAWEKEKQLVCYRLFLTTSLSDGPCPHGLFWTIRCISWLLHPPVLPSCLQLCQGVLERSDAEPGQASASLLPFQPSCGLNRDLLMCSSKITAPDLFFWTKSFIICMSLPPLPYAVFLQSPESPRLYPADRVKSILFKTCKNTSHHSEGSRITLSSTRKGQSLRQTEANLQLHRLMKASHADLRLSKWHFTHLRVQDLFFSCPTEEHRETPLRSALPCLASLEVQRRLWTLTRFLGIWNVLILSSAQY